jgi:hypothetical protein
VSFDEVVHLDREQAAVIGGMLDRAAMQYEHVRVAIDEGGVKLAIGRQSWTPPIGRSSDDVGRGAL